MKKFLNDTTFFYHYDIFFVSNRNIVTLHEKTI